ncbi:MAG: hypothetical protein FJ279_34550 [Planctomycetes bacterium]|nr:hypothetical protein [Planctomycetota bacterium]
MDWLWMLPALFLLLFFVSGYVVARSQIGHRAAIRRLPILFVLVAAALGTAAVLRRLPIGWRDHAWSAFFVIFCVWLLIHMSVCLNRVAGAGGVLVDIGRPPCGLAMATIGAGCALLAALGTLVEAVTRSDAVQLHNIARGIFWLSMGVYILFLWASKRSIRERGMIVYGQLMKWEKIQGFEWDAEDPCMLVLNVKRRLPWWRSGYVRVPADKRDAVNEVLQRKLSAGSPPVGAGSPGLPSRCAFKE